MDPIRRNDGMHALDWSFRAKNGRVLMAPQPEEKCHRKAALRNLFCCNASERRPRNCFCQDDATALVAERRRLRQDDKQGTEHFDMKLRVVIADDELLARQRLRRLLEEEPETEILAECATGTDALAAIQRTKPNLVFLDVKMPQLDGIAVLQRLNGSRVPVVIFVTAHDQFAVRAFDLHAVDYLLKPFDRERFQTALNRAQQRLEFACQQEQAKESRSTENRKTIERVAIKSHGRIALVNTDAIDWVCASDNYVELHVGKSSHFLRTSLIAMTQQLPRERFLRISRSHLVNVERIKEIRSKSHGDALVLLTDGTRLPASRKYRSNLAFLLKNST